MHHKKIIISIDTSAGDHSDVALKANGKVIDSMRKNREITSQCALPLVRDILGKYKLTFGDIAGLEIHPGPGSYTGVRVGVAIAKAIAWLTDVKINGKNPEDIQPIY